MNQNIIIKNKDPQKIITGSEAQANRLVHDVAAKLNQHYPGHAWHIAMSKDFSVIGIRNMLIHGNYGMILHTLEVQEDPSLKCVVKAAGELLERAFLNRGECIEEPTKLDLGGATNIRLSDKKNTYKKV